MEQPSEFRKSFSEYESPLFFYVAGRKFEKFGKFSFCNFPDLTLLGKSKGGLTNGGLSPKFSEKIGGKSFPENRAFSGQIGTISGLVGAFSGPIGTNSSAPRSHEGRAEIAPKGPLLARLAPFGLSPPLLSPRLDFLDSWNGISRLEQYENHNSSRSDSPNSWNLVYRLMLFKYCRVSRYGP